MRRIYFIAVNYNGFSHTKTYIESIFKFKDFEKHNIKIIIVDNKSDENELSRLENFCTSYQTVEVIKNKKNLGYFGGLNIGLNSIKPGDDDFVIIGNNDLSFDSTFIMNLITLNFDDDVLTLAPNVITLDGVNQNPHVIKNYSWLNKFKTRIYYSNFYIGYSLQILNKYLKKVLGEKRNNVNAIHQKQMNIRTGIGACYILTANFFRHYSELDNKVFLWGEEAIFANQIEQVNGKMVYTPNIIVHHHESASVNKMISRKKYEITKQSYKVYKRYL